MRKKLKKALIVFTILGLLGAFCGCSANEQANGDDTYSATEHNVRQRDDSDSVSSDDSQTESMSEVFGTSQLPESSGVPVASTESSNTDIPKSINIDELEEYYVTGVSSSLSFLSEAGDDSTKTWSLSCGEGVLLVNNGSKGYAYVYSESADDFGYVDSHYLVSDENAVCRASTYYISSDGAVLYSSINSDRSELASLTINDKVTVIAKLSGDLWYVKTEQGSVFGYINFNDLSDKKLTVPNSTFSAAHDAPIFHSISESSHLTSEDSSYTYDCTNVLRDNGTCWCEGVSGTGAGEYILFEDTKTQYVNGIVIVNGYSVDEERFLNNGRVTKLRFEFSDGTSITKSVLPNDSGRQSISFGCEIATTYIKIIIEDAVEGDKYDDTCISLLAPY